MNSNYECVVHTKKFGIFSSLKEREFFVVEVDLSIVSSEGKCGLIHTYKTGEHNGKISYGEEFLIECKFDNISLLSLETFSLAIVVDKGKQGVIALQAYLDPKDKEHVNAELLLPCIYDRIETSRICESVLLLYKENGAQLYDIETRKIFPVCDYISEIGTEYFRFVSGSREMLWFTGEKKIIFTLDEGTIYKYLGNYSCGSVFLIITNNEDERSEQLLFYNLYTDTTMVSPKSRRIELDVRTTCSKKKITRINMQWGDLNNEITMSDVDDICISEN